MHRVHLFTSKCIISLCIIIDIDECLENTHNCSMNARCENVQGTYYCRCLVGFEGDGETCTRM